MVRPLAGAVVVVALGACYAAVAQNPPGSVQVRVQDAGTGEPLPCRLTVVDEQGGLAVMSPVKQPGLAYRPGVIYTGSGEAAFTLQPGRYTLYATRGLEYGLGKRVFEAGGKVTRIDLKLPREVDTRGYIAVDTHIHTLTYSGHGDATIEERMATIAGEGIELAVATDHNHHIDYAPVARAPPTHTY